MSGDIWRHHVVLVKQQQCTRLYPRMVCDDLQFWLRLCGQRRGWQGWYYRQLSSPSATLNRRPGLIWPGANFFGFTLGIRARPSILCETIETMTNAEAFGLRHVYASAQIDVSISSIEFHTLINPPAIWPWLQYERTHG